MSAANITPADARAIDPTKARRLRGLAIASLTRITRNRDKWNVPSQTGNGSYLVDLEPRNAYVPMCTCKDFAARSEPCKHVFAVRYFLGLEINSDGAETVTESVCITRETVAPRPTYKQAWPAYNAAQINEKAKFQALLGDLCRGVPEPAANPKGGRPPVPMADRVFAVALKVYSTFSGRRASTDMRDARDKGLLSRAPHYSSAARYLEDPAMTPILMSLIAESARPLRSVERDFIVDSSGFATSRFVRWFDHKYGTVKREYDWVKVSVCTGRTTNVVTAVEIDERYAGDCPRFAPLLKATAGSGFTIGEVSADAAYLSYDNMELVASLGGTPYIAFKAGTTAGDGGTMARMFHLYNFNRDKYLNHYHKRSNVESTFAMMKAKFGDSSRSKTDTAMVNEALCKVLCHNVCCLIQSMYELGVVATFWGDEAESVGPTDVEPIDDPETDVDEMAEAWAWV
jgi:transposase